MFKYILLCSLLAHSTWAKPIEQHAHQIELSPHVVFVGPHNQVALDSVVPVGATPVVHQPAYVRYVAPHEESVVYVPVGGVHHNAEVVARSAGGIHGKQLISTDYISSGGQLVATPSGGFLSVNDYLEAQAQKQLIAQQQLELEQKKQLQNLIYLEQQEKIKQLEQKIQATKTNPLISLETPLISGAVSLPGSDVLSAVGSSIGGVVNGFLSPLLKSKSLYVVEHPHHVVDYVASPVVLSSVPVPAGTVKSRRSVAVDEVEQVAKVWNVEEQVGKESRSVVPEQIAEEKKVVPDIKPVVDEQVVPGIYQPVIRSLEAEQQKVEEKKPAAEEEKPASEIPLEDSPDILTGISMDLANDGYSKKN